MAIRQPQVRPIWADDAPATDVVDPGDAFIAAGFPQSAVPPSRQFLNWVLNYLTNGVRYLARRGIDDYASAENYAPNDIVRGADGCLYQSLRAGNPGKPPGASPGDWGRISIFGRTAAEMAAQVTPVDFSYPELNLLRYGADNTGRSPCDEAIASALSVACPLVGTAAGARRVDFPAGDYLVTTPIDLSNSRQPGTRMKDGLLIQGASAGSTRIIGKTGTGNPVIETTGAQWLSMCDLTVTVAPANPSTVGIFQGLSRTLAETQNQRFTRLIILMNDDPTANGGAGSVGIWNFGAEETTYDTLWVRANLPMMFTAHNPSPSTGFRTPTSYQILGGTHSLGMTTVTGECYLIALNKRQPSIVTEDTNSMKFSNTYLANIGAGGTNETAWKIFGSMVGADFNGLVESHGRLLEVAGNVQGSRIRATFGGLDSPSTERLLLHGGGQGQLLNSEFNLTDNVSAARALLAALPVSAGEPTSCYVKNCGFKLNCDQSYTVLPENVLWNPNTGNVLVEANRDEGKPFRHAIDANRAQEIAIPDTPCGAGGGVELVRIVLPTPLAGRNSLAAAVSIEGMLHVSHSKAGSTSVKFVQMQASLAIDNAGELAVTTDVFPNGTSAENAPADSVITSFSVRAAAAEGGKYVRLLAESTGSGALYHLVRFVGTARLRWAGGDWRAPSLRLPS